jgi:hypothetical protein
MKLNDQHMKVQLVNGQEMVIPDSVGWNKLRHQPEVDAVPLGVQDILWPLLKLVDQYSELTLALYRPGEYAKQLIPCALLLTPTGWQRVHIERLTCSVCGWDGKTANPTIPDLYAGAPNEREAFESAWRMPTAPCPRCGSKLPRHPIWVEPFAPEAT